MRQKRKPQALARILVLTGFLGFCLLPSSLCPLPSQAGTLEAKDITFSVAPNGLRIIVKHDPFAPVVALDIVVRAGSANETPAQSGASHFLEHLIFKGSEHNPPGQIALRIDRMGGSINASTLRDFTHFYVTVPAPRFSEALDLLVDSVMRPSLPRPAVEQERLIIANEQQRLHDQPLQWLWDLSYQAAFPTHPYGRSIAGPSPSPLSREDLQQYHKLWYVPNNLSVVVVGDVPAARAGSEVEAAFKEFSPRPLPEVKRVAEPPLSAVKEIRERALWTQAQVVLSFRSPGMGRPREVLSADLALTLLGEGQTSRLRRELREKRRLVLDAGGEYLTTKEPGLFSLWATCAPDKISAVREALLAEVRRLRDEPVSAPELTKAKRLLSDSYSFSNETFTDQAAALGYYDGVGSYRFATEYISLLNSLTAADLQAFAKSYLDPAAHVWCAGGPFKEEG